MDPSAIATISDALDAARPAYDGLVELAEEVDDEWSYINDLAGAWRERLDAVDGTRGDEAVDGAIGAAVLALAAEAAAIDDPHRAIDWLSTYPQVLLVAIGERP